MQRWDYQKPDNLVDLFESAVTRFGGNPLFGVKTADGKGLTWSTYRQVGQRVDDLRGGLASLGVGPGDAVGIIANNRPEWAIAALATHGRGARYVPMYEAEQIKVWQYILQDSAVKVLFVSRREILDKVRHFPDEIPTLEKIVLIEGDGPLSLTGLASIGRAAPVASVKPGPYDIATIIYTSGTTGDPKGVILSHGNFTHTAWSGYQFFPLLNERSVSISILPWAHVYGQCAELYNWFQIGGSIGFMESVATLLDDLALIRPTFILAVPRIFNKIYLALQTKMEATGGLPRRLFRMGVRAARERRELAVRGRSSLVTNLEFALANRIVFEKIRQRFGGRLEGALTGSATMNTEVAQFFFDIGIPVYDCYGLTETSPAVSMNCPQAYRLGSVGRILPRVQVEIDASVVEAGAIDGEIVVRGPNVMQGYHHQPEATRQVLSEDGAFRTGDRGRLDADGFLFITGRIKEQYKLENGKYVFPAAIEEEIKLLPLVLNAMVHGEGRPYNVCLVFPDFEVLRKVAAERGLPTTPAEMAVNPALVDHVAAEITQKLRASFGSYEIPKKFVLLTEDFTVDNGMLTQTMKLRRKAVVERYRDAIAAQYGALAAEVNRSAAGT